MIATIVTSLLLAAPCHTAGAPPFTVPDNRARCTPGAYRRLTRTEVCTPKDRPSTPAAVRRRVLLNYGVPGWTGARGELDHRVPVFLGGLTVAADLWPEVGAIPNPKDRLENFIRRRVCEGKPHPMSVRTAVRLFLADWRHAYRAYFG